MSLAAKQPFVLIIDDEPEKQEVFASALTRLGVESLAMHPRDLREGTIDRASLIIVDQYLRDWPELDAADVPFALKVRDGLALAAILRAHLDDRKNQAGPTPNSASIVLRSGDLASLGAGLPLGVRNQLIARQHDIEWAVEKGNASGPDSYRPESQLANLAKAVQALPTEWSDQGAGWLDLPDASWSEDALWQIEQCRPPLHELSVTTASREWLRWFLQKVLSFPTFLVDDVHASTMLGLPLESFEELIAVENPLSDQLSSVSYTGQLATFSGRRWWRAGVSSIARAVWPESEYSDATDELGEQVVLASQLPLEYLSMARAVVPIDEDYRSLPAVDATSAVRLQPDDWPPFADVPWAVSADLEHSLALTAMVVLDDRFDSGHRLRSDQ